MLQFTRKTKEAIGMGEGVTDVPTVDTTHSEGQGVTEDEAIEATCMRQCDTAVPTVDTTRGERQ